MVVHCPRLRRRPARPTAHISRATRRPPQTWPSHMRAHARAGPRRGRGTARGPRRCGHSTRHHGPPQEPGGTITEDVAGGSRDRDLHRLTHPLDTVTCLPLRLDEPDDPHQVPLTKKAVAAQGSRHPPQTAALPPQPRPSRPPVTLQAPGPVTFTGPGPATTAQRPRSHRTPSQPRTPTGHHTDTTPTIPALNRSPGHGSFPGMFSLIDIPPRGTTPDLRYPPNRNNLSPTEHPASRHKTPHAPGRTRHNTRHPATITADRPGTPQHDRTPTNTPPPQHPRPPRTPPHPPPSPHGPAPPGTPPPTPPKHSPELSPLPQHPPSPPTTGRIPPSGPHAG